jgi:phage-related protein
VISPASIDEKQVVFVGSAQADLDALPDELRWEAVAALSDLQNGRRPSGGRCRDLGADRKLSNISEVRLNHEGDTYRIYNVLTFREVVYVLEAGIKKSVRGNGIPQQDVRRLELRYKRAKEDYEANKMRYQAEYAERAYRRSQFLKARERSLQAVAALRPMGV